MPRKAATKGGLPTRQQVLEFIRESLTPVGKREIARAFDIKGADRIGLKAMLKDLERSGDVDRGRHRRMASPGALPEVTVLTVLGPDPDGELLAAPAAAAEDMPAPRIFLAPDRLAKPALGRGDRVLARLKRIDGETYEARVIRRLPAGPARIVGIYERAADGGRIRPAGKRARSEYRVAAADAAGATPGEIVLAQALPGQRHGLPQARVVERLGPHGGPRSASLLAIHEHDIPSEFDAEAMALAAAAEPVGLAGRTDLREIPLVTIDGEDARDFDDAVFAEPDSDPKNPGGFVITVAIADVAHYVRPGDALDRAAYWRGNSVYFPDRVVPMLPEQLSNGLCSLKPGEERGCLAVRMVIDAEGRKLRHRFMRGLMRSAARLTYEQVQAAADGRPDETTRPLIEPVIQPLYAAFRALLAARQRRGTLDLDLPERKVVLDESGHVERIQPRSRFDSHRLIEEYMIAANVAAAETLERLRQPCMYRVHDAPDAAKIEALREFVATLGLNLARGQVLRPKMFTQLLERAKQTPYAEMVHELVLRSQSQAVYSPVNIGHFGLALPRYAHFTSPIRRYSDLLVHRALISGSRLGDGGLPAGSDERFAAIGEHISTTERRAAAAERDTVDRYVAAFLAERLGEILPGRVTGVTRFGLFVRLDETGADGLVPIASLPNDFYDHDERNHALVGRRWGAVYRLGERVMVRLVQAEALTGGLLLELIEGGSEPAAPAKRARPGRPDRSARTPSPRPRSRRR
ncbi:MAG: ribonuclease [Rhodospirillaceae bacterium]|nr:ribonuclease [Rhodospirillaceae bacterium]